MFSKCKIIFCWYFYWKFYIFVKIILDILNVIEITNIIYSESRKTVLIWIYVYAFVFCINKTVTVNYIGMNT